jgi:hypothetical protein
MCIYQNKTTCIISIMKIYKKVTKLKKKVNFKLNLLETANKKNV